ncbi:MAG TPA: ribulose 1,5-bisphosphate carboxylase [Thermoplasmata archaeon]|nr:ribulose 1,5-bisphosphate carboxylase [Thermoplasmata archaeon]
MEEILAKYRIESSLSLADAAEEICKEESVGTWTKLKMLEPEIQKRLSADVIELDEESKTVTIAYSIDEYSHEPGGIPHLLSFVAGNLFGLSLLKHVRLVDIELPSTIVKLYQGPKFGIEGVRNLIGVKKRPLIGTIIKPKIGLSPKEQAEVFYKAARGGIDFGKDDENLVNQAFCPLLERTRQIAEAIDKVKEETGRKVYYAINVTTRADRIVEVAEDALSNDATCLMVDMLCAGYAAIRALAEDGKINVPLHIHRAGHAAFTEDPHHGITMLVLAKLARLAGGDQLHTGTVVGKMKGTKEEVIQTNDFLKNEWFGLKNVFPVASGGVHPLLIPRIVELLGRDIVIQAGGGVHGHPGGTEAGAKALKQALDAVLQTIPLEEYAKDHKELREAVEKWK